MDKRMTAAETWEAAKEEIARLRARVAELEGELNNCVKALEQVDFTAGCNGQMCVSGHIQTLIRTVAALEAAQEWRPASEPPGDTRDTIIALAGDVGAVYAVGHYRPLQKLWQVRQAAYETATVLGWRELPPMPEEGVAQ